MSTPENPEETTEETTGQPTGQEVESSDPASPDATPNRMAWMEDTLEWDVRAQPGKHGLTMRDINTGVYGDVPEESRDMSRKPRCTLDTILLIRPLLLLLGEVHDCLPVLGKSQGSHVVKVQLSPSLRILGTHLHLRRI